MTKTQPYQLWNMPFQMSTNRRSRDEQLLDLDRRMAEFIAAKRGRSSAETLEWVRRQRDSVHADLNTE